MEIQSEAPEYELKFDSVYDGWYRVYKVSTGAQLAYVMRNYTSYFDSKLKVNVEELVNVGETNKICNKLGIHLFFWNLMVKDIICITAFLMVQTTFFRQITCLLLKI